MELRDYISIYWKQRWLIVTVMLVATVTTYVVTAIRPIRSGVSTSLAVNRINREVTPDYQYDGYYALQAADLFAQTVVSWFRTPAILQEMYLKANLDPQIKSVDSLPSRFRVKKYSAQNIVVRFSETNDDRARRLSAAIGEVMTERAEALNQNVENKSLFAISASQPVIAPERFNPWVAAAAALVLSFGLALGLVAFRHYLRS